MRTVISDRAKETGHQHWPTKSSECKPTTLVAVWDSGDWHPVELRRLVCSDCGQTSNDAGDGFYWDDVLVGEPHAVCERCGQQYLLYCDVDDRI